MRQFVPVFSIVGLVLSLSACVEGSSSVPASSDPVAPGVIDVDLTSSVILFQTVCVAGAGSPSKSKSALATLPVRQNPQTGTYYHNRLNLSFKLTSENGGNTCSMVFVSDENTEQLSLALASASSVDGDIGFNPDSGYSTTKGPNGTTFRFSPSSRQGSDTYYSARLTSGK